MQPSWLRGLKPHSRQAVCVLLAALSVACVDGGTASPTPPPPVSDTAESAYPLAATDQTLRMECQHAAALLGFSVPCPTALPETNNPVRGEILAHSVTPESAPRRGARSDQGFSSSQPASRTSTCFIYSSKVLRRRETAAGRLSLMRKSGSGTGWAA